MKIVRLKSFEKSYRKLSKKKQSKVDEAITIFYEDIFHPQLKNHALKGDKKGFRSISAGGDLRIIFVEEGGYVKVLMVEVGSHSDLY